jgi:hypothetical protein
LKVLKELDLDPNLSNDIITTKELFEDEMKGKHVIGFIQTTGLSPVSKIAFDAVA